MSKRKPLPSKDDTLIRKRETLAGALEAVKEAVFWLSNGGWERVVVSYKRLKITVEFEA